MTLPEESEWWFSELKAAGEEFEVPAEERLIRLRHRILEAIERMDRQVGSAPPPRRIFRDGPEQSP